MVGNSLVRQRPFLYKLPILEFQDVDCDVLRCRHRHARVVDASAYTWKYCPSKYLRKRLRQDVRGGGGGGEGTTQDNVVPWFRLRKLERHPLPQLKTSLQK